MIKGLSVQPTWALELPIQQQSVLLLAARGADGVAKYHPYKEVQRAYRASVLIAAKLGRELRFGEGRVGDDTFMSLEAFSDITRWESVLTVFFGHADDLPHHFYMHLMHGAEILGYKHPDVRIRMRWHEFYLACVKELHLNAETEEQMDKRLNDWNQENWEL